MPIPILESSFRTFCKKTVVFAEHWFVKYLVRPIVLVLPPALITMAATRTNIKEQIETFIPSFAQWLGDSALLVIILVSLYFVLLRTIYGGIQHYSTDERELNLGDFDTILTSINQVVTGKIERLVEEMKNTSSNEKKITTNPEAQIGLLVFVLKSVFEHLDKDTGFRIRLFLVKNEKPVDWACFYPLEHVPRTPPEELQHPNSTIVCAIRTKSPVLVEDIAKELRKKEKAQYIQGCTQADEKGSLLCYPIRHPATEQVEYVIAIKGDKKGSLMEKHLPLYNWIIDHYVLRIILEHSLLLLERQK